VTARKAAAKKPAAKRAELKQDKPPKGAKLAACDAYGIDKICEQLIAGESQTDIASEIGVSIQTLIAWIAAVDHPERSARAREARTFAARTYADMAESELRAANDPFKLAKARELASHFRWKASKADPGVFGDKSTVDLNATIELKPEQIDERLAALMSKAARTKPA
jgi:hypothetical protein